MKANELALAIGITFTAIIAAPSYALIITNTVEASTMINVNGNIKTDSSASETHASSNIYDTLIPVIASNGELWVGGSSAEGDYTGHSKLASHGLYYEDAGFFALPLSISTSASILHTAVITNNSASAQNLGFNFLINAGGIGLGYSGVYDSESYINAGYKATISIDGTSVWHSGAKSEFRYGLTNDDIFTSTGTSLGDGKWDQYPDRDRYEWDNYYGALNLGVLDAGKSMTLTYLINTYVNEYFITNGYSHSPRAYFEDPFEFNSTPLFALDNFTITPINTPSPVPEPTGTLLLGAGLAALAFRRRKPRKTAV